MLRLVNQLIGIKIWKHYTYEVQISAQTYKMVQGNQAHQKQTKLVILKGFAVADLAHQVLHSPVVLTNLEQVVFTALVV